MPDADVRPVTAKHCPSCTCAPDVPAAHSCQWCRINLNHPKCPENAAEELCPHCGSDPVDVTLHAVGCPTIDTCAQTYPTLSKPWHPEAEWFVNDAPTEFGVALDRHVKAAHRRSTRR